MEHAAVVQALSQLPARERTARLRAALATALSGGVEVDKLARHLATEALGTAERVIDKRVSDHSQVETMRLTLVAAARGLDGAAADLIALAALTLGSALDRDDFDAAAAADRLRLLMQDDTWTEWVSSFPVPHSISPPPPTPPRPSVPSVTLPWMAVRPSPAPRAEGEIETLADEEEETVVAVATDGEDADNEETGADEAEDGGSADIAEPPLVESDPQTDEEEDVVESESETDVDPDAVEVEDDRVELLIKRAAVAEAAGRWREAVLMFNAGPEFAGAVDTVLALALARGVAPVPDELVDEPAARLEWVAGVVPVGMEMIDTLQMLLDSVRQPLSVEGLEHLVQCMDAQLGRVVMQAAPGAPAYGVPTDVALVRQIAASSLPRRAAYVMAAADIAADVWAEIDPHFTGSGWHGFIDQELMPRLRAAVAGKPRSVADPLDPPIANLSTQRPEPHDPRYITWTRLMAALDVLRASIQILGDMAAGTWTRATESALETLAAGLRATVGEGHGVAEGTAMADWIADAEAIIRE